MAKTQQVAALPWRQTVNGIEILLVTTRTTRRWVIPKGWTMVGKADCDAAAIEAFEEAGVIGEVEPLPFGQFGYLKTLQGGRPKHINVDVFALKVEEELQEWPERQERERQWMNIVQALSMIGEPELLPVIAMFDKQVVGGASTPKSSSRLFDTFIKWRRWLNV